MGDLVLKLDRDPPPMLPDSHQLAAFGGELMGIRDGRGIWRVLTRKTWLPPDKLAGDLGSEKMCGTARPSREPFASGKPRLKRGWRRSSLIG